MLQKKQIVELAKKRYANIVGMEPQKARFLQILLGAAVDGFLPPIMILATAGLGKTKLMLVMLSLIKDCLGRQVVWFPRGEDLGTRIKFVEECYIPRIHDHDAGCGIDECHEMKPNVSSLWRSLIEITAERTSKTIRACGDYEITYAPARNFVIMATNKVEKLDKPLMSRFEIFRLSLYTDAEMLQIVIHTAKKAGLKLNAKAARMIAESNRGNARDVVQWIDSGKAYCNANDKKELDEKGAREIIRLRETFPFGVTNAELQTLLLLEANGDMQLKELAGRNNVESKEQNTNETYLRFRGFIITRGIRSLSPSGREYLLQLRRDKFIPELKAKKLPA